MQTITLHVLHACGSQNVDTAFILIADPPSLQIYPEFKTHSTSAVLCCLLYTFFCEALKIPTTKVYHEMYYF